jgi:prepilin-type N-terminal cleavage/methylation domain-containing protein
MRRIPSHPAFTLLELILVMLIIAVAAAMVVPSLRTFAVARRTDNAVSSVLTLANYARIHCISESRTYRLNFDPPSDTLWLTAQNAGVFEAPTNDFGAHVKMPDGVSLQVTLVPQPNTLLVVPSTVQQNTVTITPPFGQPIAAQNPQVQNAHGDGLYMEFQPSGRVDPVLVRLTDSLGKTVNIGCQSSTEAMHVLSAGEMQ